MRREPVIDPDLLRAYENKFVLFCIGCRQLFQSDHAGVRYRRRLSFFPERLNEVFAFAIAEKAPDFALSVYSSASAVVKAKIINEMSPQVFELFSGLRRQKRGPRLDQEHLNEQMALYAERIARPGDAVRIRKQSGFCFAWSHSEAVLSVLYRSDWWDAARLLLALWDGEEESLNSAPVLPGDGDIKPRTLRELFGFMVGSQLQTQIPYARDPSFPYAAPDFIPGTRAWVDAKQFFSTQVAVVVCEEFTEEGIKQVLSTPQFKSLERDGYVIVGTSQHATYYQVIVKLDGTKTYRVFDPNDPGGRQSFGRLSLAAKAVLQQQGSVLSLTGVRVRSKEPEPLELPPSSITRPKLVGLEGRKFLVTQPEFLALLFDLSPEDLDRTLGSASIPPALWNESCSKFYKEVKEVVTVPFLLHAIMLRHSFLLELAIKRGARFSIVMSAALKLQPPLLGYFWEGLQALLPNLLRAIQPVHRGLVFRSLIEFVARKTDNPGSWNWLHRFSCEHMREQEYCSKKAAVFFKSAVRSAGIGRPGLVFWYLFSGVYPASDLQSNTVFSLKPGSIEAVMRNLLKAIFSTNKSAVDRCLAQYSLAQVFAQRRQELFNFELLQRLVAVLNSQGSKPDKGILASYLGSVEDLGIFQGLLKPTDFLQFLTWVGPERLSELPGCSEQSAVALSKAVK